MDYNKNFNYYKNSDNYKRMYQYDMGVEMEIRTVLSMFNDLKPTMETTKLPSGEEKMFYNLHGTVPMPYNGMMYNLPISIRIPDKYPQVPPEVYVVPSYWMYVRESKDVDENGRVRVYLLENWHKFTSMSLTRLMNELVKVFSQNPPLGSLTQLSTLDARTEYIAKLQLKGFDDPIRTKQDVVTAMETYLDLYGAFEEHSLPDGRKRFNLTLQGAAPGVQFPFPFCIQLMNGYPSQPPMVFVVPTTFMNINHERCAYVDRTGIVSTPYLERWNTHRCDLLGLIQDIYMKFRSDPPLLLNHDHQQRGPATMINGTSGLASRDDLSIGGYVPGRKAKIHSEQVAGKRASDNLDDYTLASAEYFDTYCDPCHKDNVNVEAGGYCKDCNVHLCDACIRSHRRNYSKRYHNILLQDKIPKP
ncbi:uncharacterized protein LOC132735569 isoform X2 [Ruditapes philippinarum]|uniref:uncharacterized protein LOC132735569 isoform X2 n=1 Tax=Ruditapes philippinarum TaxID=129788 RepID=UPI00295C2D60|nr:uncharacterized protein LOC132735569 isoform X2 [Ruditapes philippinarum]